MTDTDFYCMHSELCKTLANPKRQHILDVLRNGELPVGEIVSITGMSQANVSQHLALLRSRGIVTARRDGAFVRYSIANPKIIQAFDLISEVMRESIASQNETAGASPGGTPADKKGGK